MSKRNLLRLGAVVVLAGAFAAIWFSPLRAQLTRENVRLFVEHLRGLWYGPLAFVVIFAAGCVVALPASLFIMAAGFIWGWLLGGLYSIAGGLLGAIASFYVARFIGADMLDRFGRVGRAVTKQVDHAGFRSLLILRYIPGIPFVVLNYGAGVAGVSFGDFFAATLLGIGPSMFVFAYCADALFNGSMTQGDVFKRLALVCGLMLAITILPLVIKRLASKRVPVAE
jgi:uncharacterized membrane protein YdjX (TVP38/TMEM64 family)